MAAGPPSGYAGGQGSGTLTISNGGTMSNVAGFLGNQSGSTGTATVDGAGSTWTSIDLNVGTIGERHADHPQRRGGEQWRLGRHRR